MSLYEQYFNNKTLIDAMIIVAAYMAATKLGDDATNLFSIKDKRNNK